MAKHKPKGLDKKLILALAVAAVAFIALMVYAS